MKSAIHSLGAFCLAITVVLTLQCRAADQPALNSLRTISALSNAEASKGLPVAFTGTVTYYNRGNVDLFVQDGDVAIYVETTANHDFSAGDQVMVIGKTRASFRPEIKSDRILYLRHGPLPSPVKADFGQLIRAELDCRRAIIRGTVRSANIVIDAGIQNIYLQILMDGGIIDAEMAATGTVDLASLLDSEVEVTGAVAGKFDSKNQMTGVLMEVQSFSEVKVLKRAGISPQSLPFTPMDQVLQGYLVQNRTQRVRVQGTVTYYQPGTAVVLQNGNKSLWLKTQYEQPIQIGDLAQATGFPEVQNGSLTLTGAEIYDSASPSKVAPFKAAASELALGDHAFDLVSAEGRLLMDVREAAQDEYVLVSNGQLFSAIFKHPAHGSDLGLAPMKAVPIGSWIRVTGICILESGDKVQDPVAFTVLVRSSDDLTILQGPSPFNVRNLSYLIGALLIVLCILGMRAWVTERRARKQNARLAWMEQRRSRILEDINGSRPLLEVVEDITEMVSFQFFGAPCWCELSDGRVRGNAPERFSGLRKVETEIQARSGSNLGRVSAAFHMATVPGNEEAGTLIAAAGLIALAIENRRLFQDLQHRSDFDLLTDVHNRFSFEKYLSDLIEKSERERKVFGIIYIDLDGFKLINDTYGHQVGDRFLQQVSLRIKHQLRPGDMMARLGGDEFAVAISTVTRYEELESVTNRLEACFAAAFSIDGSTLIGSASLGFAMYPVDGSTKDSLLNSADAAMYMAKHAKRRANIPDSAIF
ncbi:MAG TPA: diguanylate cyclase [Candidatus Acidoferrales bacterium]|jgi:diguanylate cyclase (GGDEF)-like protein|nr:diguanylate cyclase [Candidatus Acidoferrales bacterium]